MDSCAIGPGWIAALDLSADLFPLVSKFSSVVPKDDVPFDSNDSRSGKASLTWQELGESPVVLSMESVLQSYH